MTAPDEPSLFEVVMGQRAHRRFRPDPVDETLIERCLIAATHAPSAENTQPWVFVVVTDATIRSDIGAITRAAWHGGARAHSQRRLTPGLLAAVDDGAEGSVAEAPVLVVVCADATTALPSTLPSSVYPAVQNLLLAASALGLGSALTTLPLVGGESLRALLHLPEHVSALAVIPIGWPERPLGPPRRQPFSDKTFRDTYGSTWRAGSVPPGGLESSS
jgi:nitroreductase